MIMMVYSQKPLPQTYQPAVYVKVGMAVQIRIMISVNNSLISFLLFGSLCSERQHCLSLGKKRHRRYLDMYISSGAPNSVYSGHSNEPSLGF